MRVLLVEDERATARLLAKGLREQAYAVDLVHDGVVASERHADADYDIVVLDVMLPRQSGLEVCRRLRAAGKHVPVLMLTARDGVEARIAGLDTGADDYLTKPFDFRELLARIRALIRRRSLPLSPDRLVAGPLTIDSRTRELFVDDQPITLTAREFALIEYLSLRRGDVVSRKDIAQHVWDDSHDPLSNVIDVYVQRLRRKIDPPGQPSLIRAHRGEGYQLAAIKHTLPGGRVRLELRRSGEQAEIVVSDAGCGVPDADRDSIFERFVRLDQARDTLGGTGLGLPIARWIAQSHGGIVTLEATSPSGSTFVARLLKDDRCPSRGASS